MENDIEKLSWFFRLLIQKKTDQAWLKEHIHLFETINPEMIITLVDQMYRENFPMDDLKTGVNKFLNLCFKSLSAAKPMNQKEGSVFDFLFRSNRVLERHLSELRPLIREVQTNPSGAILYSLNNGFSRLAEMDQHYKIIENVIFPLFEARVIPHRCAMVMWSFHDDIRKNLKKIISLLHEKVFELSVFNQLSGDIFFDMHAMKFREEKILLPLVNRKISEDEQQQLLHEAAEIGFSFLDEKEYKNPEVEIIKSGDAGLDDLVNLSTGFLSPETIIMIFNHLPVDITYVDEEDTVRYFSAPAHRVFTRTKAVIGRKVQNCHPPESLHVVNEIVAAFRSGKKDVADFRINMKGRTYLIRYFAVRDEERQYKGVLEVTQDITDIKGLTGEKRLLNWEA